MAAVRFSAAPSTTTILLKLVTCLFIFYSAFYTVSSLCLGVFRMDKFDGLMPFDFNEPPSLKPSYIAILISTEVTFLLSGLLFAIVVRGWLWDYAVSVTVVHIITTCIGEVSLRAPQRRRRDRDLEKFRSAVGRLGEEMSFRRRQPDASRSRTFCQILTPCCGLVLMATSGQLMALIVCRELPAIPIIEDRV
ncbi:putative transmembrane protein 244 [Lethenteron reissneri]|uniref:putative transmembrane protein 244 n=1 Tax=Lethenteron reissneri TaxID=7753 RepID=UPI002AB74AA3|nr:putative transmembrane protein 244 [Lethenteron reissneri]